MKREAIIITGGSIQDEFALSFLEKHDVFITAADRGLEFCIRHDIIPDLVVGDFDSLDPRWKVWMENADIPEILRLQPEKDDTDTQSAVNYVREKGYDTIYLLGAIGSRLDHVMANINLLPYMKEKGADIIIIDQSNHISLLPPGTEIIIRREDQFGDFVSFMPWGSGIKGLCLKGFKYPLKDQDISVMDAGLTVSNEIIEEKAHIYYQTGWLIMVMSRD